jgi:hypothetical protein
MTPARLEVLQGQLTQADRTVLSAVPIGEAWTMQQIQQELARLGQVKDVSTVAGWLNKLVSMRLVREPARGKFQRAKVREKESPEQAPTPPQPKEPVQVKTTPAPAAEPKKPGQLDRLAAISADMRKEADRLVKLADAIDAAALLTEEEMAAAAEETKKLKKLGEILKELGQ